MIEKALRIRGAPMSARALVSVIREQNPQALLGATPWKTVGARLAVDIRNNTDSKFLRTGRGQYGLREWPDVQDAEIPPRRLLPLDEEILAVPRCDFLELVGGSTAEGLLKVDYLPILAASRTVERRTAELTEELVQLIPSFVVLRENQILSYTRTRKTPENRLHDTRSIVFGGHLQAEDVPSLFSGERSIVEDFLFREFHEELSLSPKAKHSLYVGVLYLRANAFERQHAGLVFVLDAEPGTEAESLEPGYHTSLKFVDWGAVHNSNIMDDRWSATCIAAMNRGQS